MHGLKLALYMTAILLSGGSAVLLFRGYLHQRVRLMMWSAIFFTGLTVYNVALLVDVVVLPNRDLRLLRMIPVVLGTSCLVYGFIWEAGWRFSFTDNSRLREHGTTTSPGGTSGTNR